MNIQTNVWISGQRMLPYSLDPELSRNRHADPDYYNSSDVPDYNSDQMISPSLPSSPPKTGSLAVEDDQIGHDYDDEPTEDDEEMSDTDHVASTSTRFVRPYSESTLRPGSFVLSARAESSSRYTPEKLIAEVFDNERVTDIPLDNRGLQSLPEACRDLIDHEDLYNRRFKLDLTNNSIFRLNRFIYDIRRLDYLSLRLNKIEELTPLIDKLVELQELHLGNNSLTTLPVELLGLPKLRTLTTYPNNFMPLPENGDCERLVLFNKVPSLVELSRREIARAGFLQVYNEFEKVLKQLIFQFPKLPMSRLLGPVLDTVYIGRICSICRLPVIEPSAMHFHWKKHGEDRSGETIPFQTVLCSLSCLRRLKENQPFSSEINQ